MKIMDVPAYGPMFRFSDANVYYALYLLTTRPRIGRKSLAEMCGVGEGSIRHIIASFKKWGFVDIHQTGISITQTGMDFLREIPIRFVSLDIPNATVSKCQKALIVYGVASKIESGMQQRDVGVRSGATGCTTIVIRNGALMIPPDWNIDIESPEIAKYIRTGIGMGENDAIIIGDGETEISAVEAAVSAAFTLI